MVGHRLSAFLDACKSLLVARGPKACPFDSPKERPMAEAWQRAIEAERLVTAASEKDGKPVEPPAALVEDLAKADALFLARLREWESEGTESKRS